MTLPESFDLLGWVARALGAFYVFAGVVTVNAWRIEAFADGALEKLTGEMPTGPALLRRWTMAGVGFLTLGSGVLLMLLSPLAPYVFLACATLQGAYFAWARQALPPTDDAGRRGRRASLNAFFLFCGCTVFVLGCQSVGLLR